MRRSRRNRRSFLDCVKELFFGPATTPMRDPRRPRIESLETRRVMDADLGVIVGHVYRDANANSAYEAGEKGIDAVQVLLYRDNGDGMLNTANDPLVGSKITDASGEYRFDNLDLGTYFVRRPAQMLGAGNSTGVQLTEKLSAAIHLEALKSTIDDFDLPTSQTAAVDTTNDGTAESSIAGGLNPAKTIGGEREILANFSGTATGPGILISGRVGTIDVGGQSQGLLLLDATSSAKGTFTLVWDGQDNNASTTPNLSPGLGGVNLTSGGADHLRIKLNSLDLAGATVKLTVYTSATQYSTATATLVPRVINGVAENGGKVDYQFKFDGSGEFGFLASGTGGANFTSVNAVTMEIVLGSSDIDARLELLGAYGVAQETADLAVDEVDISTSKTVDNSTPVVGSLINYTLTVSNAVTLPNGLPAVTATGIWAVDELFANTSNASRLTYVSDSSGGAFNPTTGVWNVGELAPGASRTIVVTVRVNDAARPTTTNVVQITSVLQHDPDLDDWRDDVPITPTFVDIGVNKTVDNARPNHNEIVEFTVTAKNNGTGNAQDVSINDSITELIAAGFQFIAADPSVGTYNEATGVWLIPALAVNESVELKLSFISTGCRDITNTATLGSLGGGAIDVVAANNTSSASVSPREADLGITKQVVGDGSSAANTSPNNANPIVKFQLVITNTGPDDATGVVVNDPIPAGMAFVSSDGDYDAATGNWNVGTVATGATRTLTITMRMTDSSKTILTNNATITELDQCDENEANDSASASVSPQQIDLSVTKTVDRTLPTVGENVVFTVTVTNSGPNTATGVNLADILPAALSFVGASASQGSFFSTSGLWTVGTVGVGQSATLTLTAKVNSVGTHTNNAEVVAADQFDIDSTPSNGRAGEDDIAAASVSPQAPIPQGEPIPQAEPLTKRRFLAR